MNAIGSASSFASSASNNPSEPPIIPPSTGPTFPAPQGPRTGPGTEPVLDTFESPLGDADHQMFATAKTTIDCPPGTKPTVTVDGQKVVVICEPPKHPSPAPILK
jgi:hypothetical protein